MQLRGPYQKIYDNHRILPIDTTSGDSAGMPDFLLLTGKEAVAIRFNGMLQDYLHKQSKRGRVPSKSDMEKVCRDFYQKAEKETLDQKPIADRYNQLVREYNESFADGELPPLHERLDIYARFQEQAIAEASRPETDDRLKIVAIHNAIDDAQVTVSHRFPEVNESERPVAYAEVYVIVPLLGLSKREQNVLEQALVGAHRDVGFRTLTTLGLRTPLTKPLTERSDYWLRRAGTELVKEAVAAQLAKEGVRWSDPLRPLRRLRRWVIYQLL